MFNTTIVLFYTLALVVEIIGTISWFWSSVFFIPLAKMLLPFYTILWLTSVLHVSSNLSKLYLFQHGIDKKALLWIGIPSVLGVIAGAIWSKYIGVHLLSIILGIFLIAISSYELFAKHIILPKKPSRMIGWGTLAGVLAWLIGTGWAIRWLTLASFALSKDIFIATSAAIDLGVDFSRMIIYISQWYIQGNYRRYIPWLMILAFVGSFIGKKALHHISQKKFETIVLVTICIIGVITIIWA